MSRAALLYYYTTIRLYERGSRATLLYYLLLYYTSFVLPELCAQVPAQPHPTPWIADGGGRGGRGGGRLTHGFELAAFFLPSHTT